MVWGFGEGTLGWAQGVYQVQILALQLSLIVVIKPQYLSTWVILDGPPLVAEQGKLLASFEFLHI